MCHRLCLHGKKYVFMCFVCNLYHHPLDVPQVTFSYSKEAFTNPNEPIVTQGQPILTPR